MGINTSQHAPSSVPRRAGARASGTSSFAIAVLLAASIAGARCAGAADAPASLEEIREKLASQLAEQVNLRTALGDGRGAARTFITLAAVHANSVLTREAAWSMLAVYENTALPGDIRTRLLSPDASIWQKAVSDIAAALSMLTAEHKVPEAPAGTVVLGPADGCPVTHARGFARGANGAVVILAEGLVICDGSRWQVMQPSALRVCLPVHDLFVDRQGRTWIGSMSSPPPGQGSRLDAFLAFELNRAGFHEPSPRGDLLGRWHAFRGLDAVTSFAESKNTFWLATQSGLFTCRLDRLIPAACPLPFSPFRKLIASPDSDDLWVADLDRVSRFDGKRWQSWKLGGLRPVGGLVANGKPVIVTASGLLLPQADQFALLKVSEAGDDLASAAAAKDGTIWCVSQRGNVFKTDLKTAVTYPAPVPLAPGPWPPAIFCDDGGRIWLSRGRGIEVAARDPGAPAPPRPVAQAALKLDPAPLVSAAGSGGWLRQGRPLDLPDEKERPSAQAAGEDSDLGGFKEDDAREGQPPKDLIEQLRKSPDSGAVFTQLMKLLDESPDPKMRNEALTLAADGMNQAFFSDPARVVEFVRSLLDAGRPVHAYMALLDALQNTMTTTSRPAAAQADPEFRRAVLQHTLYESLVAMGFGEFARPAFLSDLDWSKPGTAKRVAPGVRARVVGIELEAGQGDFEKAGLHQALILADKRAVLASAGDFDRWKKLVADCHNAGDTRAAERYELLTRDLFEWPKAAPAEGSSHIDSVALSPFHWIRRASIRMDSGLGPITDGRVVYLFDEGRNAVLLFDVADGSPVAAPKVPGELRAILAADSGVVIIARNDDGFSVLRAGAGVPQQLAPIKDLSDSFDGSSATAVKDDVFYCFDGGLTKVDLKAGKVAWRNGEISGDATPWRTLLERSLPVPDGGDVFVAANNRLYCVDAASGEIRWAADCRALGTPAVAGNLVVVGSGDRNVIGLDRKTGKQLWQHIGPGQAVGAILSDGERVFYAMTQGDVAALEARTGRFLWRRPTSVSISLDPPPSAASALLLRGGRLVVCNPYGYLEFDTKDGAILRRLDIATARPIVSAPDDRLVIATAPDTLVCVASQDNTGLAVKMLAMAEQAADKEPAKAVAIARLIANYVDPANRRAHEIALKLGSGGDPRRAASLYSGMLSSVDPFAPDARALMRDHLGLVLRDAPSTGPMLRLFVQAHIERGGLADAIAALEAFSKTDSTGRALLALLDLDIAAGRKEQAVDLARRLAAMGADAAGAAFIALAAGGMEEEALEIAAPFAGKQDTAESLVYRAVALSGSAGLFERAAEMLDRSAAPVRAYCLAYLFSNAGVAPLALAKSDESVRRALDQYRQLLNQRLEAVKLQNRPEELKAIEEQIELLKAAQVP